MHPISVSVQASYEEARPMLMTYRVSHDSSTGYSFIPVDRPWQRLSALEPGKLHQCPTCGHVPDLDPAIANSVYDGPLVPDVEPDAAALGVAQTAVRVLLEVASGRRPLAAASRHATPEVVHYLKLLQPSLKDLPALRLRSWHAAQPQRWVIEANALIILGHHPQAVVARFEPDPLGNWVCTVFRILRGGARSPEA
ncbi:Rv3235 family protein [Pseudonocardia sp. WMMC193]|uniref:Rv3235 family protein n=1 Tax=Pseudonocardia sp. WMMC193 TaxID=2911965 RepID=UPI001F3F8BF4|nr:Rv3235 family protein [Pseudonocardia sp. WMMC193]MCF7547344.1 Rv3235 family protein [Pseudonocardia sp. WMMC193]